MKIATLFIIILLAVEVYYQLTKPTFGIIEKDGEKFRIMWLYSHPFSNDNTREYIILWKCRKKQDKT